MSHTPFAACSALATMARRDRSCAREHPEQPEAPSVEASPAINLKCYGHAVEGFLRFGRNGSRKLQVVWWFLAKVQRYSSAVRTFRAHHRSGVQFNLDAGNRVRRIAD